MRADGTLFRSVRAGARRGGANIASPGGRGCSRCRRYAKWYFISQTPDPLAHETWRPLCGEGAIPCHSEANSPLRRWLLLPHEAAARLPIIHGCGTGWGHRTWHGKGTGEMGEADLGVTAVARNG